MTPTYLAIVVFIVFVSILISILCIKQKYKDQKACFFVDIFSVTAAGASLVISSTVLYQTTSISNVTNLFENYSQNVGRPASLSAQIELTCVDLGDGGGLECQWQPGVIGTR